MSLEPTWNLVSWLNMNSHHLRKTEIEYELKIRGFSADGTANELRKRLSDAWGANSKVLDDKVNQLNTEAELELGEEKLKDLSSLTADYEGNGKDNEYKRISARLWHLLLRVGRIPVDEETDEDLSNQKTDLLKRCQQLLNDFTSLESSGTYPLPEHRVAGETSDDTTRPPAVETNELLGEPVANQEELSQHDGRPSPQTTSDLTTGSTAGAANLISQPPILASGLVNIKSSNRQVGISSKSFESLQLQPGPSVPVYKWGLTFSNLHGESIGAFLQRVEELRRARGVSEAQLFQSAVDLFSGSTLIWYRSTVGRIKSWGDLCSELKVVFQTPDYDDMLLQEIMNRTQGSEEHIDLFIAALEGLYGRLSTPVPEHLRLRQILKNLNPWLQDKLCMFDVTSIEQLRQMGRKAELGRLRTTYNKPPPKPTSVMEPDLAYTQSGPRRMNVHSSLNAMDTRRPKEDIKCWNCDEKGHPHFKCTKTKKQFCFGCGKADVIKSKCPNCGPKNL